MRKQIEIKILTNNKGAENISSDPGKILQQILCVGGKELLFYFL